MANALYRVVSGISIKDLENDVFVLLQDGWRLVGGIAVHPDGAGNITMFYQAMTKGGKSA